MSQTRKIASCLTAVLLMCCIIQGEMLWLEDLLREQALPEQNDRYGFDVYLDTMELVWGELVWFPVPESDCNENATTAFENTWINSFPSANAPRFSSRPFPASPPVPRLRPSC